MHILMCQLLLCNTGQTLENIYECENKQVLKLEVCAVNVIVPNRSACWHGKRIFQLHNTVNLNALEAVNLGSRLM